MCPVAVTLYVFWMVCSILLPRIGDERLKLQIATGCSRGDVMMRAARGECKQNVLSRDTADRGGRCGRNGALLATGGAWVGPWLGAVLSLTPSWG